MATDPPTRSALPARQRDLTAELHLTGPLLGGKSTVGHQLVSERDELFQPQSGRAVPGAGSGDALASRSASAGNGPWIVTDSIAGSSASADTPSTWSTFSRRTIRSVG